jgi:DNA repair protein RadD
VKAHSSVVVHMTKSNPSQAFKKQSLLYEQYSVELVFHQKLRGYSAVRVISIHYWLFLSKFIVQTTSYFDLAMHGKWYAKKKLHRCQKEAVQKILEYGGAKTLSPAMICMPTGTGKTAVMAASPFELRATRVLFITPGPDLSKQLSDFFALQEGVVANRPICRLGLLTLTAIAKPNRRFPRVKLIETTSSFNRSQLDNDIVICNVQKTFPRSTVSSELEVFHELDFDLVIVDEAHHLPAERWTEIVNKFHAKKLFFTATPFRTDGKPIGEAKIVYNYPLRRAVEEYVRTCYLAVNCFLTDSSYIDKLSKRSILTLYLKDRTVWFERFFVALQICKNYIATIIIKQL